MKTLFTVHHIVKIATKSARFSYAKCCFHTKPIQFIRKQRGIEENKLERELEEEKEVPFEFDDHTTPAQEFIRQIQYVRKYLRKAKYELPKLSEHYKEFKAPVSSQYLTMQTVEHLGETHKCDVLATMIIDLNKLFETLSLEKRHLLLLLCEEYYLPERQALQFSFAECPSLEQNQFYLLSLWNNIYQELQNAQDYFTDIPISKAKRVKHIFPKDWLRPIKTTSNA